MATERLSMRKTKEILRQKWALGRSHREIAASLGVSVGSEVPSVSARTGRRKDVPVVCRHDQMRASVVGDGSTAPNKRSVGD